MKKLRWYIVWVPILLVVTLVAFSHAASPSFWLKWKIALYLSIPTTILCLISFVMSLKKSKATAWLECLGIVLSLAMLLLSCTMVYFIQHS